MATRKAASKRKAPAQKKTTAKKAPAKKVASKKVAASKAAAPARKTTAIKDKMTKSQMYNEIATSTGLNRKEVASVFEELESLVERSIKKRGVGEFTVPGLMKVVTVKKPARKARKNVPNPFKPGETMDVPAKPASIAVKVRPLKKLKEFAAS